jgi:hypothetical protein
MDTAGDAVNSGSSMLSSMAICRRIVDGNLPA